MNTIDWTTDKTTNRVNSSAEFDGLVEHVSSLIFNSAHDLIKGRAECVARLIMAQLAHVHGLAPSRIALKFAEEERQMVIMALAHLSIERPGWDDALNRIATRIDNVKDERAVMYDEFRRLKGGTS